MFGVFLHDSDICLDPHNKEFMNRLWLWGVGTTVKILALFSYFCKLTNERQQWRP